MKEVNRQLKEVEHLQDMNKSEQKQELEKMLLEVQGGLASLDNTNV